MRSLAILLVFPWMLTSCDIFESHDCQLLGCSAGCEATEFGDFSPGQVTIRYESEERTVEHTFRPDYQRVRPNGPDRCVFGRRSSST